MIISLEEARFALRLDDDADQQRDAILAAFINAAEVYIHNACGDLTEDNVPLAKTAAMFLIQIWYYGESVDAPKLTRTLESILKSIA